VNDILYNLETLESKLNESVSKKKHIRVMQLGEIEDLQSNIF